MKLFFWRPSLLEAHLLLYLSKLMIILFPFRKIIYYLGEQGEKSVMLNDDATAWVKKTSKLIKVASSFTLYKSKCYDQALAAKIMLRMRFVSSTIYFGVQKSDKSTLSGHVWLRSGNLTVTGGDLMDEYVVMVSYSN